MNSPLNKVIQENDCMECEEKFTCPLLKARTFLDNQNVLIESLYNINDRWEYEKMLKCHSEILEDKFLKLDEITKDIVLLEMSIMEGLNV